MNTLDIDAYDRFLQLAESTDWAMLTDEQRQLALQFVTGEAEYAAYATTLYSLQHHLLHEPMEVPELKPDAALRQALHRKYGNGGSGSTVPRLLRMVLPVAAVAAMLVVAVGYWGWPGTDGTTHKAATSQAAKPETEKPTLADSPPAAKEPILAQAEQKAQRRQDAKLPPQPIADADKAMEEIWGGPVASSPAEPQTMATAKSMAAATAAPAPDLPTYSRPVAEDWALVQAVYR